MSARPSSSRRSLSTLPLIFPRADPGRLPDVPRKPGPGPRSRPRVDRARPDAVRAASPPRHHDADREQSASEGPASAPSTGSPLLYVLLAAVLTWAAHSSVIVVLLVMSLAAAGLVPVDAALALVLGANLGTAINPLLGGPRGGSRSAAPAARQSRRSAWSASLVGLPSWPSSPPSLVSRAESGARGRRFPYCLQPRACRRRSSGCCGPYAGCSCASCRDAPLRRIPRGPLYLDPAARGMPAWRSAAPPRSVSPCRWARGHAARRVREALVNGDRRQVEETGASTTCSTASTPRSRPT